MATGDWTDASDTTIKVNRAGAYVLSNTVDMTDVIADTSVTGAANDIVQCLAIPADTLVTSVILEVTTVSGVASSTIDIGDGDDADGWDATVDANSTGLTNGDGAFCMQTAGGKLYTTADTIDMTVNTASAVLSALEFKIWAVCIPLV